MASKKSGRVICGVCNRIIYDPERGRRTPQGFELREMRSVTGMKLGKLRYQYTRRYSDDANFVYTDDQGDTALFVCPGSKCSIRYRVPDFHVLRYQAIDRGEDLILTHSYRV